jgi:alpha-1,3-rhamnosyltransferase
MSSPLISIIIASYNHANYLTQCIESVLAQSIQDFEIVIVDDGSTDRSLEIIQTYCRQYPKFIRFETHDSFTNLGISATVNKAFSLTRGQYVCGLPSDDWLPENALEIRLNVLKRHPECGWVHGRFLLYDELTQTTQECGHHNLYEDLDPFMTFAQKNPVAGMTVLARREIFMQTGDHDTSLVYSDWDFWARMLEISKPAYCNQTTAYYRSHQINTSLNISVSKASQNELAVLLKFAKVSSSNSSQFSSPETKSRIFFEIGIRHFYIGDLEECKATWRILTNARAYGIVNLSMLKSWIKPHLKTINNLYNESLVSFLSIFCDAIDFPKYKQLLLKWAQQQNNRIEIIQMIKSCHRISNFGQARHLIFSVAVKDPSIFLDPTCRKVLIYGLFAQFLKKPNAANVSGILPN